MTALGWFLLGACVQPPSGKDTGSSVGESGSVDSGETGEPDTAGETGETGDTVDTAGEDTMETAEPVIDEDGDGYGVEEDCDDGDPSVNPGAKELRADGVDNDCDGVTDGPLHPEDADAYFVGRLEFVLENSSGTWAVLTPYWFWSSAAASLSLVPFSDLNTVGAADPEWQNYAIAPGHGGNVLPVIDLDGDGVEEVAIQSYGPDAYEFVGTQLVVFPGEFNPDVDEAYEADAPPWACAGPETDAIYGPVNLLGADPEPLVGCYNASTWTYSFHTVSSFSDGVATDEEARTTLTDGDWMTPIDRDAVDLDGDGVNDLFMEVSKAYYMWSGATLPEGTLTTADADSTLDLGDSSEFQVGGTAAALAYDDDGHAELFIPNRQNWADPCVWYTVPIPTSGSAALADTFVSTWTVEVSAGEGQCGDAYDTADRDGDGLHEALLTPSTTDLNVSTYAAILPSSLLASGAHDEAEAPWFLGGSDWAFEHPLLDYDIDGSGITDLVVAYMGPVTSPEGELVYNASLVFYDP